MFVRFQSGSRLSLPTRAPTIAPLLNNTTNLTYNIYPDRNGVISWTHSFSPTFFSEFLFSDSWEHYQFYTGTSANDNVDAILGLPNPFNGVGWPAIRRHWLRHHLLGVHAPQERHQHLQRRRRT